MSDVVLVREVSAEQHQHKAPGGLIIHPICSSEDEEVFFLERTGARNTCLSSASDIKYELDDSTRLGTNNEEILIVNTLACSREMN
jgi:hypothetical protein